MNGSQRPVSASPSLLDRVTSLCESEEERAVIQRLCIELNIGPGGAELAYVLLTLELAAMVRRRDREPEKPAGAVVLVSVQPEPKSKAPARPVLTRVKRGISMPAPGWMAASIALGIVLILLVFQVNPVTIVGAGILALIVGATSRRCLERW